MCSTMNPQLSDRGGPWGCPETSKTCPTGPNAQSPWQSGLYWALRALAGHFLAPQAPIIKLVVVQFGSEAPTPRWCLGQNNQNNFSVLHFEHKWTPPPRISMKFYIRLIPCSPTKPELKAMDRNNRAPLGPQAAAAAWPWGA